MPLPRLLTRNTHRVAGLGGLHWSMGTAIRLPLTFRCCSMRVLKVTGVRCLARGILELSAALSIALFCTVSPALSQTVHSPEASLDCKGVQNGNNKRDQFGGCCLLSEQACGRCYAVKPPCGCDPAIGPDNYGTCCNKSLIECGRCNGIKPECGCGSTDKRDKNGTCCPASKQDRNGVCCSSGTLDSNGECCAAGVTPTCGRCGGCRSCPTSRCRAGHSLGWPMYHEHSTSCPGGWHNAGPVNLSHGQTFYKVILSADYRVAGAQPCCGGQNPGVGCADPGKSGWIYATYVPGELLTCPEAGTARPCTCNDGSISCQ